MRVNRLLSMLLIISGQGTVTGKALAEHFEVSLRTIYRDIEKISEAGIPVASTSGKGGGYYIMDSYNVSNLFLNGDEAHTLVAVMKNLHGLFGRNEAFNDILLKVEHTYKREPGKDKLTLELSHFSMKQEIKEYLGIISKAITDNRVLVFDYINRDMEYLERTVEPGWIDFRHGHWYVIGFCRVRNDYRRFKLVRIRQLELGLSFAKEMCRMRGLPRSLITIIRRRAYRLCSDSLRELAHSLPSILRKRRLAGVKMASISLRIFFLMRRAC